jgi:tetratricopeptide (TPR) repeat protein
MTKKQVVAMLLALGTSMASFAAAQAEPYMDPAYEGPVKKHPMNLDKYTGIGSQDAYNSAKPEMEKGWECLAQKQWDQAINHFRAAIALYPNLPKTYIGIGRALEGKHASNADIETAYKESLKLDSANWRAWKRLANVLYEQKKYGEARQALGSAISLNVPPKPRAELDNMIKAIDSQLKNPASASDQ